MTGFRNAMMGAAGAAGGGYAVDNSAVFNDDDSQYLTRTNASATTTGGADAQKKFTISLWWKHGNIPSGGQNLYVQNPNSSNYLKCAIAGSGGNEGALQFFAATTGAFNTGDTTAVLRDFHAWYHILFYYDSTDGTAGDRARIYLNGIRLTDFQTSATNPGSGATTQFGSNNPATIGRNQASNAYSDGYMAEMVVIDGQALTPSSFTETDSNGVLRPLDISAQSFTFGDQGFYLPFTASGALGADYGTTRTAPSIAFVTSNSSTTNTTSSYTFSSQSLGAAASDRKIFLCASMSAHTVATLTFGTVTIGGVTATQLVASETYPDPHNLHPMAIFVADVPSGTTGDIVLNVGSGHSANCGIAIYRATACGEMFDSGSIKGNASGGGLSVTTQVPKGGFVLLHGNKNSEATRVTLTNVTEDYDFACEPDAGGDLGIFGGLNTSAASSDAVGLTTTATSAAGSAFGQISISVAPIGDTSLKAVNSPTQTTDSPTTNAATFSSLITRHQTSFNGVASDWTFTNGNRTLTHTSGSSGDIMAAASQLLQPGQKYHFEAVTESMHSSEYARFQLALVPHSMWSSDASPLTGTNDQFTFSLIKSGGTGSNTAAFDNGSLTAPTNKPTTNSRLTFEVDMSTIGSTTVRYYFNGSLDTTYSSLGFADEPYYVVSFTGTETDRNGVFNFNFGSSAFTDTPTSGHTGLTAKDAFAGSAPAIEDGSAHFQTTLYTGNGSTQEINQTGNSTFKPDLLWLQGRESYPPNSSLYDVQRSDATNPRRLTPNQNFSEHNDDEGSGNKAFESFDADGFSFQGGGNNSAPNANTKTMIAWQWLADNTTGSSNSNGSITSTVSVNQTAGFSIVSWTGSGANATIGHGLGAVPKWIVVKNRDSAGNNWPVYHVGQGNTHHSFLDLTNAATTGDRWQDTTPTSTVFSVDGTTDVNKSTDDMIAYCWAEVPGFSKFGSFSSGSSGDPFVECGFTPALIFLKRTSAADSWYVQDIARDPNNPAYRYVKWDDPGTEASNSGVYIDIISNGFVCDLGSIVTTDDDMIFGAWAEHPFAGTTPATAR